MANRSKAATELFILTAFGISFSLVYSVLNVEELYSVQYGFEILSEPVLAKEAPDVGNTLLLSSKHGQQYQCTLPELVSSENLAEEAQSISKDEIPLLLEPMKKKCLYNNKGWWTYEVCLGKGISQYHEEGHQVVGEKISLGVFSSETDWSKEKVSTKVIKKPGKSGGARLYHSQYYVNGSKCDLTGQLRETQIKFFCEEGSADVVSRVDEPSSCHYVITVNTNKLCKYMLFKSAPTQTAKSITCSPALSEERYKMYREGVESKRKAKEEAMIRAHVQKRKLDYEDEIEEDENDDQEKKKKRKSRRSQVWPWEDPGVEGDDELWIDGNIGQDQIGVHRLDIRKGRRRADGGMDDGDSITIMSQKVQRQRLTESERIEEDNKKENQEDTRNKKVKDDEKQEGKDESKLDRPEKTVERKEIGNAADEGESKDGDEDSEDKEEKKEKKASEDSVTPNDGGPLDEEQEMDEKFRNKMQKSLLKMRAALKKNLLRLGIDARVLEEKFKEKLGDITDADSNKDQASKNLDKNEESKVDSQVDKDGGTQQTGKLDDITGEESNKNQASDTVSSEKLGKNEEEEVDVLVGKDGGMQQTGKRDQFIKQESLLESLKQLTNVVSKDVMETVIEATAAGQEALEKQFSEQRVKMEKEIERTRTMIREVEQAEQESGFEDEHLRGAIDQIKEAIKRFEKTSKQLEEDMLAIKELNKEILGVVQDQLNNVNSDFKETLVRLSAEANKLLRRIVLSDFLLEEDVFFIRRRRREIPGYKDEEGKTYDGVTTTKNGEVKNSMDLVIGKLSSMIQNLDTGELDNEEGGVAAGEELDRAAGQEVAGVDESQTPSESAGVDGSQTPSDSGEVDEDGLGNRVKVRVSKIKKVSTDEETGLDEESDFDEEEMEEMGINKKLQHATKKMEELVKQQLKDSGVVPAGKIRVKIVTSKEALKNGKSGMKLLSDREENQFTDMIMGLLGGSLEAGKERKRQENLENNYNLVWSEDKLQQVEQEEDDSESEVEIESY